jgi:hypothetical protein
MNNQHLIPPSVTDIVEKLSSSTAHTNEKLNYIMRLEAIRDYCAMNIDKHNNRQFPTKPAKRGYR